MHNIDSIFESLLDSLDEKIALIDRQGMIIYVNHAWEAYWISCGLHPRAAGTGINYLQVCDKAAAQGDQVAKEAANGIRMVLSQTTARFVHEYPCHDETVQRWFMMRVTALHGEAASHGCAVISHLDITDRKLAEQRIENLAMEDALTGLPNRRQLDRFLHQEWQRGMRNQTPVSLIMADIDHFKDYNDAFGHLVGDACLRKVAQRLQNHARRPSDLAARFGGEEFSLVLGNTPLAYAKDTAEDLRVGILRMQIQHRDERTLSISAGVACLIPRQGESPMRLIEAADNALYRAKQMGRNQTLAA
ncbi:MAG: diguanylate cyclase [Leptothrix sp. (in: b-proteobacteria)]